jgi:hypothetical protein
VETSNAPSIIRNRKARGSIGSESVVVQNDEISRLEGQAWDGATYRAVWNLKGFVKAATPSSADMEASVRISACAAGSGSATELFRLEHGTGLSMSGTNVIVDANRHFQLRSYTVAALPAATTAGQMIYVSNMAGGAEPAFSDGTNWRRMSDRTVAS